jgi:hypothetical protein
MPQPKIRVKIGSITVDAMLDSGAEVNVMAGALPCSDCYSREGNVYSGRIRRGLAPGDIRRESPQKARKTRRDL